MPSTEKRGNGPTPWRVRFINADGERDSASGFADEETAYNHGLDQETDIRRGVYIDPRQGAITVDRFSEEWIESLEVGPLSLRDYRSRLRAHILPRWGDVELGAITAMAVRTWRKKLLAGGLSQGRVDDVVMVLRIMLDDAVTDRLITANPILLKSRRGKFVPKRRDERLWAPAPAVVTIAENARTVRGLAGYGLVMTLAYTGLRIAELAALRRDECHLLARRHTQWIDARKQMQYVDGVYQRVDCKYDSARKLVVPPFLADILSEVLASHAEETVFLAPRGGQLVACGGTFYETWWQPIVEGCEARPSSRGHRARPAIPAVPGMETLDPHGLRHGHKVWLDEDGCHPKVAVETRMGHRMQGVEGTYSHVSPEMERRISEKLQERWEASVREAARPLQDAAAATA